MVVMLIVSLPSLKEDWISKIMNKKKHILDWYIENTPKDDEEYEKGCLSVSIIVIIIFTILLCIGLYLTE